jgi:hypothetical protein
MANKTIQSIALDPNDNKKYIVTLTDKIAPGESPKLGYTKGDILSTDGGVLQNVVDYLITNNAVASLYQKWSGLTNNTGAILLLTHPYQAIITYDSTVYNIGSETPFTWNGSQLVQGDNPIDQYLIQVKSNSWIQAALDRPSIPNVYTIVQSNFDIKNSSNATYFAKTTT